MSKKPGYILAIDQGTTSSRAIIFNHNALEIGSAQEEFPQYFPEPGWVEQDPEEIWNSVQSVLAGAFIQANIHPSQIDAIGITNQRETTVIWDRATGTPIYPAIVWQSRQSAEIADQLRQKGYTEAIHQKTGLVLDAYFSATKIRWILDHVPGAQTRAEQGELAFGTIDTWLLWKLTEGTAHITDYTNASRTMLFNIHTLTWDEEILSWLDIPKALLPDVKSNAEIYGYAESYHFSGKRVPIAGMAGDQQAALIGQQALDPGMIKNTYGTGAFIMMNIGDTPKLSHHQLLTTIAFSIKDNLCYALEGSIFVAGSAIQWLRDGLQMIDTSKESETLAKQSQADDSIYVVPAFTGLGAPYWDPEARGAIFGLTRGTQKEDIVKATLESIAYQTKDVIETMQEDTQLAIPVLSVDGGAAQNNYLMQFQSDILNIPVIRTQNLETTALGAAYLAGLAIGYWDSLDELKHLKTSGTTFRPKMSAEKRQQLYLGWKAAVYATQAFQPPTSSYK